MVDDARGADQEVQGKDPILTPRVAWKPPAVWFVLVFLGVSEAAMRECFGPFRARSFTSAGARQSSICLSS